MFSSTTKIITSNNNTNCKEKHILRSELESSKIGNNNNTASERSAAGSRCWKEFRRAFESIRSDFIISPSGRSTASYSDKEKITSNRRAQAIGMFRV
jgi:hypothetical protein